MISWFRLKKIGQVVAVDTIALFAFSTLAFFIPAFWELVLAKTTWTQSWQMRALGAGFAFVKYVVGGVALATLSDWFQKKLPGGTTNAFARASATGLGLWSMQAITYFPSAWATGMSVEQVLLVQGVMLLESPAIGWLYRKVLEFTRSQLGQKNPQL